MSIISKVKNNPTVLKLFVLFLLLSQAFASAVRAKENEPIKVVYGIFVKKIVPDFKSGMFYAEFYWWINFKNDSAITKVPNEEILDLEYINAYEADVDGINEEIQDSSEYENGEYYFTGYHQGNFFFNPDFTRYPFDKQCLQISIENTNILSDKLILVPDYDSYKAGKMNERYYGLSKDLLDNKSVNYRISKSELSQEIGIYNTNFGDREFPGTSAYSRLNLSVYIDRAFAPFITKLIIPLGIILFLVYFVFFIPADKIDMAAALIVTSLLSAIAFQLSVNSDLAEIGYIIYVDKIFYTCYFLIAISMAESLWTFYLDSSGDERKKRMARRIDFVSRFLFPLSFIFSLFYFAR